jgi:hypothetical protein
MQSRKAPMEALLLVTLVLVGCAMTAPGASPDAAEPMGTQPMADVWPSMTVGPKALYPAVVAPQARYQSNRESACTAYQPGGSSSATNCF